MERTGREGEGERRPDVDGPGKWSAPGPALALGGPLCVNIDIGTMNGFSCKVEFSCKLAAR